MAYPIVTIAGIGDAPAASAGANALDLVRAIPAGVARLASDPGGRILLAAVVIVAGAAGFAVGRMSKRCGA